MIFDLSFQPVNCIDSRDQCIWIPARLNSNIIFASPQQASSRGEYASMIYAIPEKRFPCSSVSSPRAPFKFCPNCSPAYLESPYLGCASHVDFPLSTTYHPSATSRSSSINLAALSARFSETAVNVTLAPPAKHFTSRSTGSFNHLNNMAE